MNNIAETVKGIKLPFRRPDNIVENKTKSSFFNSSFFLSFSTKEQIIFTKRLGMVLRSGMPILQGLRMLEEEAHSKSIARIAKSLGDDVGAGLALSNALKKFENIFGQFYINIVRVGETSGTLPENLEYIAQELKKKDELRKKVVGALLYPAVIVVATLGITVLLIVYIFPKILPIFLSLKATLPLSTRILISLSTFLTQYGLWVFLGIIVFIVSYLLFLRIYQFSLLIDNIIVRLPIFGRLSQYYNLANSCRTLSLLLKSDVRIAHALEITTDSLNNKAYKKEFACAGEAVLRGERISNQLKTNPALFPPLLTQMMSVGEATGNLSDTLMYLSDMYEAEISDWTKNLASVLEPVLMLTMGLIVGFIAISVITPIYGITQNLSR